MEALMIQGKRVNILSRINVYSKNSITPSLIVVYVIMILVFSLINPRFFSVVNFKAIMASLAISGIVAVGLTPVVLTGNFDISIGSIFGLAMVVVAKLFNIPGVVIPIPLIILAGLMVGVVIGAFNGFLVTKVGINSIIVTLGALAIFRGLTFYWSLDNISIPKEAFLRIGRYFLFDVIPLPFIYFVVLLAVGYFLLRYSRLGRDMYLVGANSTAARLAGLKISKTQYLPFLISGIMSALGGVVNAAQVGFANSTFGTGYEFKILTIVVLGGISLNGGRGRNYFNFRYFSRLAAAPNEDA
jgi:ribose transport system permease protein